MSIDQSSNEDRAGGRSSCTALLQDFRLTTTRRIVTKMNAQLQAQVRDQLLQDLQKLNQVQLDIMHAFLQTILETPTFSMDDLNQALPVVRKMIASAGRQEINLIEEIIAPEKIFAGYSNKYHGYMPAAKYHYLTECRLFRVARHVAATKGVTALILYDALRFEFDGATTPVKRAVVETYTDTHTVNRHGFIVRKH